jgi:hypothetical protein
MKKPLSRNRIRGISFHRTAPSGQGGRCSKKQHPQTDIDINALMAGAPTALSRAEIHKLLQEHGRHTLHTLMSDSVEIASQWRQASRALDKKFETFFFLEMRDANIDSESIAKEQVETLLQSRRNFRLWKHRIAILEMIAAAQQSLS